ncbi:MULTISPECIES: ethanolamine permease [Paenibacillus]|uniref:Ethanolamine permease n=1 Tax=Paenibacillus validus TaxID=44253 RepID=A0A7X2Z9Y3_9BACL|nr:MULTISPECIES: ethanolamine permease [Paenibacillus]MUG71044.1 ethanolamine permease [Paenibacillus validus]
MQSSKQLAKTLKPIHLWAITVGMVIAGQYFGWNYGFKEGGIMGLVIASLLVTVFFTCFTLSYSELATSIPDAGGPSAYARQAMGPLGGYITGIACLLDFVFAPPAIAVSTGAYLHFLIPAVNPMYATIGIFILFIVINLQDIKGVAVIELVATIAALIGLAVFYAAGIPHVETANLFNESSFIGGGTGIMAAIPFAIWFFLAVEGGAMASEEMQNPQKNIPKGLISSILTLAVATILTLVVTAGLGGGIGNPADHPLPQALSGVYGEGALVVKVVAIIGLLGLVASLNGIIIGYSRQTYALARAGYFPAFMTRLNGNGVPVWALIIPGVIGIVCAASATYSDALIILSVFGAVLMYCLCMISLFILRRKHPHLDRPYKVSFPFVPGIALLLGLVFLFCVIRYSVMKLSLPMFGSDIPLWAVLLVMFAVAFIYYGWRARKHRGLLSNKLLVGENASVK